MIFFLPSTSPYYNLEIEDWFLRSEDAPKGEVLLFYNNAPSVVTGRFQNPWKELNFSYLEQNNINWVRRMSGGGTVYHDEGNLNVAWIGPKESYSRHRLLELIKSKFLNLGVEVEINERQDLVCSHFDGVNRKISGSAYKQTKDRALHHLTILFNVNLQHLSNSLKSNVENMESKGIKSVRSKVMNLTEKYPELTQKMFLDLFNPCIWQHENFFYSDKFSHPDWLLGETPAFTWKFSINGYDCFLESRKGRIITFNISIDHLETNSLEGSWVKTDNIYEWSKKNELNILPSQWKKIIGI